MQQIVAIYQSFYTTCNYCQSYKWVQSRVQILLFNNRYYECIKNIVYYEVFDY